MKVNIAVFANNSSDWDRIEAGRWDEAPSPSDAVTVRDALEIGDMEEPLGFDGIWCPDHFGTPYPAPESELHRFAALAADRAWNPAGTAPQMAAGQGSADRRAALSRLSLPAAVIHGADDPLIPAVAGEEIAEALPKSWFVKVAGMGHDLPAELFGLFVATMATSAARAT